MFKELCKLSAVALIVMLLAGCSSFENFRASLFDRIDSTATEAKTKLDEAKRQLNATKDAFDDKVDDIKTATREVKEAKEQVGEAVDAVKKVTE